MRAVVPALLLVTLGCRATATPDEKRASFEPYLSESIDGLPVARFLYLRTALLVIGARPAAIEEHNGALRITFAAEAAPSHSSLGSGAALTADGYYLTASHNIAQGSAIHLCAPRSNDRHFAIVDARVVWKGSGAIDLALLHAPLVPAATFEWTPLEAILPGAELVSFGLGPAAGQVKSLPEPLNSTRRNAQQILRLPHSVPLVRGDSGGPLATRDGRLAGVNIEGGTGPVGGRYGIALRPAPGWLEGLIERDRRQPREKSD